MNHWSRPPQGFGGHSVSSGYYRRAVQVEPETNCSRHCNCKSNWRMLLYVLMGSAVTVIVIIVVLLTVFFVEPVESPNNNVTIKPSSSVHQIEKIIDDNVVRPAAAEPVKILVKKTPQEIDRGAEVTATPDADQRRTDDHSEREPEVYPVVEVPDYESFGEAVPVSDPQEGFRSKDMEVTESAELTTATTVASTDQYTNHEWSAATSDPIATLSPVVIDYADGSISASMTAPSTDKTEVTTQALTSDLFTRTEEIVPLEELFFALSELHSQGDSGRKSMLDFDHEVTTTIVDVKNLSEIVLPKIIPPNTPDASPFIPIAPPDTVHATAKPVAEEVTSEPKIPSFDNVALDNTGWNPLPDDTFYAWLTGSGGDNGETTRRVTKITDQMSTKLTTEADKSAASQDQWRLTTSGVRNDQEVSNSNNDGFSKSVTKISDQLITEATAESDTPAKVGIDDDQRTVATSDAWTDQDVTGVPTVYTGAEVLFGHTYPSVSRITLADRILSEFIQQTNPKIYESKHSVGTTSGAESAYGSGASPGGQFESGLQTGHSDSFPEVGKEVIIRTKQTPANNEDKMQSTQTLHGGQSQAERQETTLQQSGQFEAQSFGIHPSDQPEPERQGAPHSGQLETEITPGGQLKPLPSNRFGTESNGPASGGQSSGQSISGGQPSGQLNPEKQGTLPSNSPSSEPSKLAGGPLKAEQSNDHRPEVTTPSFLEMLFDGLERLPFSQDDSGFAIESGLRESDSGSMPDTGHLDEWTSTPSRIALDQLTAASSTRTEIDEATIQSASGRANVSAKVTSGPTGGPEVTLLRGVDGDEMPRIVAVRSNVPSDAPDGNRSETDATRWPSIDRGAHDGGDPLSAGGAAVEDAAKPMAEAPSDGASAAVIPSNHGQETSPAVRDSQLKNRPDGAPVEDPQDGASFEDVPSSTERDGVHGHSWTGPRDGAAADEAPLENPAGETTAPLDEPRDGASVEVVPPKKQQQDGAPAQDVPSKIRPQGASADGASTVPRDGAPPSEVTPLGNGHNGAPVGVSSTKKPHLEAGDGASVSGPTRPPTSEAPDIHPSRFEVLPVSGVGTAQEVLLTADEEAVGHLGGRIRVTSSDATAVLKVGSDDDVTKAGSTAKAPEVRPVASSVANGGVTLEPVVSSTEPTSLPPASSHRKSSTDRTKNGEDGRRPPEVRENTRRLI